MCCSLPLRGGAGAPVPALFDLALAVAGVLEMHRIVSGLVPVVLTLFLASCGGGSDPTPECRFGSPGCVCLASGGCEGSLACVGGICRSETCTASTRGTLGCQCGAGASCGTGLTCNERGYCESPDGRAGGPCYSNRTCDPGLICNTTSVCEACAFGSEGCACFTNQTCAGSLSCLAGICAGATGRETPPANPVCHTPCRTGTLDPVLGYRACSAEGLMDGCLAGQTCTNGQCVAAGTQPTTCARDSDCPDFQTCIAGSCYSNCTSDSDCSSSTRCFRASCRVPCSADGSACPEGQHCTLQDATFGYCEETPPPSSLPSHVEVEGTYEVSPSTLAYTNRSRQGTVRITNHSPRALDFVVRKTQHTVHAVTGATTNTTTPLSWVAIGPDGGTTTGTAVTVSVPGNGGYVDVNVDNPSTGVPPQWDGRIAIESAQLGNKDVPLTFASVPDGRWVGKAYYFTQFGTRSSIAPTPAVPSPPDLLVWAANRGSTNASVVGNALIQKWGALRDASTTSADFQDAVTSIVSESWRWADTRQACAANLAGSDYCYPVASALFGGVSSLTDDNVAYPVPSGVVDLPIAIDLFAGASSMQFNGHIVSSAALQYPANPSLGLTFSDDPTTCSRTNSAGECLTFVESLSSDVVTGGRYITTSTDTTCSRTSAPGLRPVHFPWLLSDFLASTEIDLETNARVRVECRDSQEPTADTATNQALATGNPIPDGRSRIRHISLVDGIFVNQETLYLIVREQYAGDFLGANPMPFDAYALMVLRRSESPTEDLTPTATPQSDPRSFATSPSLSTMAACTSDVQAELGLSGIAGFSFATYDVADLASRLLSGVPTSASSPATYNATTEVHYLCHTTGQFDGGRYGDTPCPAGSNVTFFATTGTGTVATPPIAANSCQDTHLCGATMLSWSTNAAALGLQFNPIWRCSSASQVYCDDDRLNLRSAKTFFKPAAAGLAPVAVSLLTEIDGAFRYKTQFQSRDGSSIGFAPQVCIPNSNSIPYCYDPNAIERVRRRVDCLTQVYQSRYSPLTIANPVLAASVHDYLAANYSTHLDSATGISHDGFERRYAELLVMLGDDAYTRAFQTRFDLAGESRAAFEGSKFEPNGIDVSGVAGFEFRALYQASQYYGLALDRFYADLPYLSASLNGPAAANFVTQGTVTNYFDRVLRASTQRARAASEIAKRYQALGRADLARSVASRAYASAYLESMVIGRLMLSISANATPSTKDQLNEQLRAAGTVYRAALLQMQDVYATLTDEVRYFGFAPEYIPLPPAEPGAANAYVTMSNRAQQSMQLALQREETAISSARSFDTDTIAFQAELVRIRNTYEDQLASICGTMTGTDGHVYPAIARYASLNSKARLFGDPCGVMGTGQIHDSIAALENTQVDVAILNSRFDQLQTQEAAERQRAADYCHTSLTQAQVHWQSQNGIDDLEKLIRNTRTGLEAADRAVGAASSIFSLGKCSVGPFGSDCPAAIPLAAALSTLVAGNAGMQIGGDAAIAMTQTQISNLQRDQILVDAQNRCDLMQIDSEATLATIPSQFEQLRLEALKAAHNVRTAAADLQQLRNTAVRLQAEQDEQQSLTIDLEAARNDPNVRIYRNDAMINAEVAFDRAIQDAYRATRVFEYYSSQTYAHRGDLALVRLVGRGEYNLQNYLADLQAAYYAFQESYGNPDLRVAVISLRDDIFQIPRIDAQGRPVDATTRSGQFQARLTDSAMLDPRGYLAVPFTTDIASLSPLTRNHKIEHIEVSITGSNVGSDAVGRVYLSQTGAGTVRALDDSLSYPRFPNVTAVINPFFGGQRVYDPSVYRSERLRDRPFANMNWTFYFNQVDEAVNQDIDLASVSDIRLIIYYTDFTAL